MGDFVVWMERRNLSARTIRAYSQRVADVAEWLGERDKTLSSATWRDIRRFAETKRNTYPTRSGLRNALTNYYRSTGHDDGGLAWAVPIPKRKRGTYRGLDTDAEKDRMLRAARSVGTICYAMCCTLYYQGLRREECARLRWDDIRDGVVTGVGKCDIEFELPVHPKFAEALEGLEPDGSPYVFPGRWPGTHVSPATVWLNVRLAGERAGLGRVVPHQLRHTSTAVINDTVGLREAATFARHTDIQTTMIYTRTKRKRLLKGMAAL